jgi:hypothetical protein
MVKIYIKQTTYGSRGPIYRVEHDGEVLLASTPVPFFDGARALAKKGLTGEFEMWDHERPYPRMMGVIEKAAKLTVWEGEKCPTIRKWEPRNYDADS